MSEILFGFDYGLKYIGLSVGENITCKARPLKTLLAKNGIPDWYILDNLVLSWNPCKIIVGVPYINDINILYFCLRKFIKKIKFRYNLPVYEINEDYTTWEAKHYFLNYKHNKNFIKINSLSATIILDSFFKNNQII